MNPGRYFMPSMAMNQSLMRSGYAMNRGMSIFNRLAQGIRSFNWSGLLNGANKTLNVMNQTIPLVKQAGPMLGNFRSMLHLAKAFRKETSVNKNYNATNNNYINKPKSDNDISYSSTSSPTFFI